MILCIQPEIVIYNNTLLLLLGLLIDRNVDKFKRKNLFEIQQKACLVYGSTTRLKAVKRETTSRSGEPYFSCLQAVLYAIFTVRHVKIITVTPPGAQ